MLPNALPASLIKIWLSGVSDRYRPEAVNAPDMASTRDKESATDLSDKALTPSIQRLRMLTNSVFSPEIS